VLKNGVEIVKINTTEKLCQYLTERNEISFRFENVESAEITLKSKEQNGQVFEITGYKDEQSGERLWKIAVLQNDNPLAVIYGVNAEQAEDVLRRYGIHPKNIQIKLL
jgi:hypothetical protein